MASQEYGVTIEVKTEITNIIEIAIKVDEETVEINSPNTIIHHAAATAQNSIFPSTQATQAHRNAYLKHLALSACIHVGCLEPIAILKKRCARLGFTGNFGYEMTRWYKKQICKPVTSGQAGLYVVETIMDHDNENHLYLIKWRGYGNEFNTWEPIDHLYDVADSVKHFRLMEKSLTNENLSAFKKLILLNYMLNELTSLDNQDPYILLKLCEESARNYKSGDLLILKKTLKTRSKYLPGLLMKKKGNIHVNYLHIFKKALKSLKIIAAFESFESFQEVFALRKEFFKNLKTFETLVNETILQAEKGSPLIEIENNCDLDLPPTNFTYIASSISRLEEEDNCKEPLWHCMCDKDCILNPTTCCPGINNANCIYNKRGCINNLQQTKIFECNSNCKCPPTCLNRVIQKGRKVKLGMFKTEDDRGWGVKALEGISKGQFVTEYVGEIVTAEEAYIRSTLGSNPIHKSYLFDLSEGNEEDGNVLDGEKFGNISRFINHSCSPNLEVFMFWADKPNIKIPGMAFFSKKNIAKGKELTIDYRMTAPEVDDVNVAPTKRIPCKCMKSNCRKFLF